MPGLRIIAGSFFITGLIYIVSSCGMKTKTVEPYTISIDSLAVPDTVKIKTTFEIQIYGYIGPSKCYAFDKAYIYPDANADNILIIEAWGIYTYVGDPCTDDPQYLDSTIETSISLPGVYTIRGIKSNYSYAEKSIVVVL